MTRPFDRYTVLYFAVVVGMLLVGIVGLFSGEPIAGVG